METAIQASATSGYVSDALRRTFAAATEDPENLPAVRAFCQTALHIVHWLYRKDMTWNTGVPGESDSWRARAAITPEFDLLKTDPDSFSAMPGNLMVIYKALLKEIQEMETLEKTGAGNVNRI